MNRLTAMVQSIMGVKSAWDRAFFKNTGMEFEDEDILGSPYTKSDLVYICISTTAKAIAQVPLRVMHLRNGKYEYDEDNPWQKLLNRPNYLVDRYKLIEAMVSFILLYGNAYIIPYPPDYSNSPLQLWCVGQKNVDPRKDKNTGALLGWTYSTNGTSRGSQQNIKVDLDISDVSHMFLFNPYDPIIGLSPLEAGKLQVVSDYKTAKYNQMFFENGAEPGGVFWTEGEIPDKQYDRIKAKLDSEHKGYKKAKKYLILEGGLQYSQTGLTHKDMEFVDLSKFSMSRILQIFGMKKVIISETEDSNYATAQQQRRSWWEDTNLPIMTLIETALNFTFFYQYEEEYKFMFDLSNVAALQESFGDKVKTAKDLFDMGFSSNEINDRLGLGFKAVTFRDYVWRPMAMIPYSLQEEPDNPIAEPKQPVPIQEPEKELLEDAEYQTRLLPERNEYIWRSIILRTTENEKLFEKKVKRTFFDMRKKTLDLLYKKAISRSYEDVVDEFFEMELDMLSKASRKFYEKAIHDGLESLAEELGIDIEDIPFTVADEVAVNFMRNKTIRIKDVGKTIRNQLNKQISSGMEAGESIDQIAERIKSVFNMASGRAKTIARTEVTGATNFSRHEAIKRTSFALVQWFTALDERVRSTHVVMHGKVKPKNKPWVVGGYELWYPGDYSGPPEEVINCRCIEVVVPSS